MATDRDSGGKPDTPNEKRRAGDPSKDAPDWAGGLKQLYDSVVEEPLPDAFKDLLDKLDDNGTSDGAGHA